MARCSDWWTSPRRLSSFHHGYTVGLNAALTRRGAKAGMLVTAGSPRHRRPRPRLAPVRRQPLRPDVGAPAPGAPGRRAPAAARGPRADARERRRPAAARRGGHPPRARVPQGRGRRGDRHLLHATPTSIPSTRQRVREIVAEVLPDAYVQTSQIWPLAREFERTFVVMLDAYTGPPVVTYLKRLEERLADAGFDSRVEIMQMDGGPAVDRVRQAGAGLHAAVGPGGRAARRRDLLARAARRPRPRLPRHRRHLL